VETESLVFINIVSSVWIDFVSSILQMRSSSSGRETAV